MIIYASPMKALKAAGARAGELIIYDNSWVVHGNSCLYSLTYNCHVTAHVITINYYASNSRYFIFVIHFSFSLIIRTFAPENL